MIQISQFAVFLTQNANLPSELFFVVNERLPGIIKHSYLSVKLVNHFIVVCPLCVSNVQFCFQLASFKSHLLVQLWEFLLESRLFIHHSAMHLRLHTHVQLLSCKRQITFQSSYFCFVVVPVLNSQFRIAWFVVKGFILVPKASIAVWLTRVCMLKLYGCIVQVLLFICRRFKRAGLV